MKVCFSLMFLGCLVACGLAHPSPLTAIDEVPSYLDTDADLLTLEPDWEAMPQDNLQRVRRQLNVQGGGSPRQGFDLSINGRAPVWQSNNGRHSLDATGQYSQHLGGPYGNSRPNWGAGAQYTFRF
ncbi:diptericin-A-like [Drosophila sulfurigaster albostrigata]|uniref:diptericin-A-like n=1 Tax=Drosophila sulfurigaster albostrigata TaxID=89887 RepID=UPI002D21DCA3|nr:diptericin-A-like [Drosophila sulfurigaster albostrigata]